MAELSDGNGSKLFSNVLQTITVVGLVVGAIWAGVINPQSTKIDKLDDRSDVRIGKIETNISEVKADLLNMLVTLREFTAFKESQKDKFADSMKTSDDAIRQSKTEIDLRFMKVDDRLKQIVSDITASSDKTAKDISNVRDNAVTRAEHSEVLAAIAANRRDTEILRDNLVTRSEHNTHWEQIKDSIGKNTEDIGVLRRDFGGQYTVAEKIKDLQNQIEEMRAIRFHESSTPIPPSRPMRE